jgi:hypothetical protein
LNEIVNLEDALHSSGVKGLLFYPSASLSLGQTWRRFEQDSVPVELYGNTNQQKNTNENVYKTRQKRLRQTWYRVQRFNFLKQYFHVTGDDVKGIPQHFHNEYGQEYGNLLGAIRVAHVKSNSNPCFSRVGGTSENNNPLKKKKKVMF